MKLPPTDKMGHFGGGAAVAGVVAALALVALHLLRAPLWVAVPIAFAAAFGAGRWKERYDAEGHGTVDTGDWQWTTWGAAPVALPIAVLLVLALMSGKALATGLDHGKAPSANPSANASASATAGPTTASGGEYNVYALPGGSAAAPSVGVRALALVRLGHLWQPGCRPGVPAVGGRARAPARDPGAGADAVSDVRRHAACGPGVHAAGQSQGRAGGQEGRRMQVVRQWAG